MTDRKKSYIGSTIAGIIGATLFAVGSVLPLLPFLKNAYGKDISDVFLFSFFFNSILGIFYYYVRKRCKSKRNYIIAFLGTAIPASIIWVLVVKSLKFIAMLPLGSLIAILISELIYVIFRKSQTITTKKAKENSPDFYEWVKFNDAMGSRIIVLTSFIALMLIIIIMKVSTMEAFADLDEAFWYVYIFLINLLVISCCKVLDKMSNKIRGRLVLFLSNLILIVLFAIYMLFTDGWLLVFTSIYWLNWLMVIVILLIANIIDFNVGRKNKKIEE